MQEKLFDEFISLKFKMQNLASIVQNEGIPVSDNELNEWSDQVNEVINKLSSLRYDVLNYYNQ